MEDLDQIEEIGNVLATRFEDIFRFHFNTGEVMDLTRCLVNKDLDEAVHHCSATVVRSIGALNGWLPRAGEHIFFSFAEISDVKDSGSGHLLMGGAA